MLNDPAEFFKLLSDETRLRCLVLLHVKKELCVCEFESILKLSQPKLSRHLSHLRRGGLVVDRRKEQWVYYRLHPELSSPMRRTLATNIKSLKMMEPYSSDIKRLSRMHQKGIC